MSPGGDKLQLQNSLQTVKQRRGSRMHQADGRSTVLRRELVTVNSQFGRLNTLKFQFSSKTKGRDGPHPGGM